MLEDILNNYKPDLEAIDSAKDAQIALLVGITGAGKDTIKQALLGDSQYYNFISYTTRQPRENRGVMEVDGIDYNFISPEIAQRMLHDGDFIEAKEYAGNIYGTSFEMLKGSEGKIAVNDIEVQGVDEYKRYLPQAIAIFIVPPNFSEWQRRLQTRYDKNEFEKIWPLRREAAIRELEHALEVPYYHFVINDNLDDALAATKKIIAHQDIFTRKDDEARLAARSILDEIRAND